MIELFGFFLWAWMSRPGSDDEEFQRAKRNFGLAVFAFAGTGLVLQIHFGIPVMKILLTILAAGFAIGLAIHILFYQLPDHMRYKGYIREPPPSYIKEEKLEMQAVKKIRLIMALYLTVTLAIVGGGLYVVGHFIAKFW